MQIHEGNKPPISPEIKKVIENHKVAAAHLNAAANRHLAAAKDYEEGNHEDAALNAFTARRHLGLVPDIP